MGAHSYIAESGVNPKTSPNASSNAMGIQELAVRTTVFLICANND